MSAFFNLRRKQKLKFSEKLKAKGHQQDTETEKIK